MAVVSLLAFGCDSSQVTYDSHSADVGPELDGKGFVEDVGDDTGDVHQGVEDTEVAPGDAQGGAGVADVASSDVRNDVGNDAGQGPGEDDTEVESVEVLVMFLDTGFEMTTPVDIRLNGSWYHYEGLNISDPIWNSSLLNARGHIVTLEEPLTHVEFDPDQLIVEGLNNHGFGFFNYTVQKRHPDTDLTSLSTDPDDFNYWASDYEHSSVLWARNGYDDTFEPSPTFYDLEVPAEWSDSGKMTIYGGGHGRNHPGLGPDEHPEIGDDDDDDPDDADIYPIDDPPPPAPGEIQIAVTFLDRVFFDVTFNGVVFPFSG